MISLCLHLILLAYGSAQLTTGSEIAVAEGSNVTLTCSATSWNLAAYVEWQVMQDGSWTSLTNQGAVDADFAYKITVSSSRDPTGSRNMTFKLNIANVGSSYASLYQCEAFNNGSLQNPVNHTVLIYRKDSIRTLRIGSISAYGAGRNYRTINWRVPTGSRDEKWHYRLHTRFIYNNSIITREHEVVGPYPTYPLAGLYPCSDYKLWVTAYSKRYAPRNTTSGSRLWVPRQVLPGVYRLAVSDDYWLVMNASAPDEIAKRKDIGIFQGLSRSSGKCDMIVTWKPSTIQPYGCPIQGIAVSVKTPDSWPRFLVSQSRGGSARVRGVPCDKIFLVKVQPYNKNGRGDESDIFDVQFNTQAPPPPSRLEAEVDCDRIRLTWTPPTGTFQRMARYEVSGVVPGRRIGVPSWGTSYIRAFSLSAGTELQVNVTAISNWGTSKPAIIKLKGKDGCSEQTATPE